MDGVIADLVKLTLYLMQSSTSTTKQQGVAGVPGPLLEQVYGLVTNAVLQLVGEEIFHKGLPSQVTPRSSCLWKTGLNTRYYLTGIELK